MYIKHLSRFLHKDKKPFRILDLTVSPKTVVNNIVNGHEARLMCLRLFLESRQKIKSESDLTCDDATVLTVKPPSDLLQRVGLEISDIHLEELCEGPIKAQHQAPPKSR